MQIARKLIPIVLIAIAVGLILAGVFLYLEFGGVEETLSPYKLDLRKK